MSDVSELKIGGRRTYQKRDSVSPVKPAQVRNKSEEYDDNSSGYEGASQSKVQHGSPQFRKKKDFKTPEREESPNKDFSTTYEDPLITSIDTSKDASTSFQDISTSFQDTWTTHKGSLKNPKNPSSSSKVSSPTLKNTSSTLKHTSSTSKNTSSTFKNTTTIKNISSTYKSSSTTSQITSKNSPKFSGGRKKSQEFTLESFPQPERGSSDTGSSWLISVGLIIAVAIAVYAVPKAISSDQNLPLRRNCSFEDFKSKYQNQDNILWKSLRVQIEGILNRDPAVPSAFLFLYTNRKTEDLVWKIAKKASACFDPSLEPMKLDNADFTSQESIDDYGVIIKKYKEQVGNGGALVVANLNEIPGQAARALHAICDTYSPIVDRVVIFMTLRVQNEVGNPIVVAENTLNKIWGASIKQYELDPLITRVTEQVFYLPNES